MTECEARTFAVLFSSGGPQFAKWRAWTETEESRATHPRYLPPRAKAAKAAPRPPFRVLDDALAGRSHLLGEDFSVADLNVVSVLVTSRPAITAAAQK